MDNDSVPLYSGKYTAYSRIPGAMPRNSAACISC